MWAHIHTGEKQFIVRLLIDDCKKTRSINQSPWLVSFLFVRGTSRLRRESRGGRNSSSQLLQTSPVIVCGNCRSPEWPPLAIERPCRLPLLSSAVMWQIEAPEGAASTRLQRRASSTMGCLSRLHRALVLRRWSAVEAEGPRVLGAGGRVRDGGAVEFLA